MNGRNFLDLALLVPGVSPTNVASTQLFAETSAVPGGGLSVGSQRNLSNNFIVDGLSANDDAAALSGIPYGVDAVDQFQVVTSGGQAELGRALGGYFNVVTKSGTNADSRRSLRLLPRRQPQRREPAARAGAADEPAAGRRQHRRADRRDRTFYFTNLERRNLDQSGLTTISGRERRRRSTRGWRRSAIRARRSRPASIRNPVKSTHYLGKIDHQVSRTDQFSVRYSLYDVSSQNSRGAGGLNAPSASSALDNIDQTIAFSNTWTLSPRTVNETRAQVAHGDLQAPATDAWARRSASPAWRRSARSSSSPTRRVNTLYQVVNNLSHQAGAHALRAGIDILYNDDTITYPAIDPRRLHVQLAGELPGRRLQQRRLHPDVRRRPSCRRPTRTSASTRRTSGRSRRGLTLNAGLRYDLQFLETIRTDRNNVSPRVGFAWSPLRLAADHRPRQRRAVLRSRAAARARERAAVGEQHQRRGEPAPDQHQPVADAGGRAGVSQHPGRGRAVRHAAQPDDDEPRDAERVLAAGERRSRAADRRARHGQRGLPVHGRARPDHLDQPERAVVRRRRAPTTAAGRIRPTPTTASTRRPPSPATTACTSRSCSGRRAGGTTASRTPTRRRWRTSASSSSARRSIRSISRRTGAARTTISGIASWSTAPLTRRTDSRSSGMRPGVLGAAVQHHVRRDDAPGHRRPPDRGRRVHPEKRRHRSGLLQHEPAPEPHVHAAAIACGWKGSSRASTSRIA